MPTNVTDPHRTPTSRLTGSGRQPTVGHPPVNASTSAASGGAPMPGGGVNEALMPRGNPRGDVAPPRAGLTASQRQRALEAAIGLGDVQSVRRHLVAGAEPQALPWHSLLEASPEVDRLLSASQLLRRLVPRRPDTSIPNSPVFQALWSLDLPLAKQLYDRATRGMTPEQVWPRAVAEGRTDLLIAALVLHPGENMERTLSGVRRQDSPNSELHRPLQLGGAPGLAEHLKQHPYYSEKRERQTFDNLNGGAFFAGHEGDVTKRIVCRHLSMAWLLQHESTGKPDYQALGSIEAIARQVPQLANALHTKVLGSSQDVRIVRHDDWRKFVVDRFGELERSGAQAARMFITSGGHAMAAEFKLKGRPGEPTQYVLKVYDPSVTPAHKRASSDDPSRLQTESLADFLAGPAWFDSYFGHKEKVKEKVFAAISIPATGVASLPELPSGGFGDRRVSGEVPPLDASAMHHVMTLGLGGTLRDMGGELLQLARSSPQEAHDLLIARDAEGRPGLCTAASYDRADTIATYCEVVSASALPPELKASLLESRSVKGTPALYAAAYTASAVTCQALIDGILQSGLESPVRAGLLTGAIQGVPAMNIAAQQGRVEIVQAFVERVSRSDLPVSTQVELLAARGADGVSALAHLARWGHGAIDTLVRSVLASRLPSSAKVELLRAEHDGHPVLQTLLAAAAPDAVAGYRQAVLNAELEPHDRAALLGMSSR